MPTITYAVEGMTCEHCVQAVSSEVGGLAGVADVRVDLDRGTVTVAGPALPGEDAIRAAVDEAGYELRGTV